MDSIQKLDEALNLATAAEELNQFTCTTQQAKKSNMTWKTDLLCSVRQVDARINAVNNLDEDSFMLVED